MVQFISNNGSPKHAIAIRKRIKSSEDCFIAVAFLKLSGLRLIRNELHDLLNRGGNLTAVVGTDFWLTEPKALLELFELQSEYPACKLYIYERSSEATYHPKYYRFQDKKKIHVLVGSANLTNGGISSNIELSIGCTDSLDGDFAASASYFEQEVLKDKRCIAPDIDRLRQYESERAVCEGERKKSQRNAKKAIHEMIHLDQHSLNHFLKIYKGNKNEQANLIARTNNYKKARRLLSQELASSRTLGIDEFRKHYEALVGARNQRPLWHSGGLARLKAKVIKQHRQMQKMTREIHQNLQLSPTEMYELGMRWMPMITNLGPNVFTEICNSFAPEKYPVLNKNPTTSLLKLGQGNFPPPAQFKPADYEKYCEILARLRDKCGFSDFGETDHFLNFVYQKTKSEKI